MIRRRNGHATTRQKAGLNRSKWTNCLPSPASLSLRHSGKKTAKAKTRMDHDESSFIPIIIVIHSREVLPLKSVLLVLRPSLWLVKYQRNLKEFPFIVTSPSRRPLPLVWPDDALAFFIFGSCCCCL